MSVYVDQLMSRGMEVRGQRVRSCHLFTDGERKELVVFGAGLGLASRWLQVSRSKKQVFHFDLTEGMRVRAIAAGAKEVSNREAAKIWTGK